MIIIGEKELIPRFIELSYLLKSAVSEQNLVNAKKHYQDIYSVYQQINASSLEKIHKEVAYQQVVEAYHSVQGLKNDVTTPTNIIAIAIVIIIVSTIIFVNPRMVGLAVFQEKILHAVDAEFLQTGSKVIDLKYVPSSLAVSGSVRGNAKLFVEVEGRRLLILDSTKIKDGVFKDVCVDSCLLPKISTTRIVLSAELDNAVLNITSLSFYTRSGNKPPIWGGEPKRIIVNGETTVDFKQYFSDANDDELVYLAIMPEGMRASVSGSVVTVLPDASIKGQRMMELIVSDMKYSTRARILLDIQ